MGNNRVESVISIARDITEMKQTEARLSESEQRFRSIVESSPDAFYLMRAVREGKKDDRNAPKEIVDFVFEYINAQGAALVTIPPEQLLGKRLTEAFTGERATLLLERYAEVVERGIPTYEDYRAQSRFVKDAAGAPFEESRQWLHSQYLPIGEMLAITTSDITSRMNVDRALRQSEERYRRLVENASEAIFSTGKEGYFTYANPYIRELGGFGDEDVTKYFFTDLVVPSHKNQVKRHFFRQFLSRSPDSYIEAPFTAKDGSEKWLAITTSLRLHGEEVDGFDCVAADVTERRRIESEVRDARTHESGNASEERRQLTELLRDPLTNILEVSRGLAGGYTGISVDEAATQIALHAERALAALD
jgi:PAS domain S-box-containing protein